MATIDQIKQLRDETGISISECRKALEEAQGNFEKAKEILRKWGKEVAGKKSERTTGQGIIDSYIHPNKKIGVMLDLRCESDFVAKSGDFKNLSHELALHIAAMSPLYIKPEEIPEAVIAKEREIYKEQVADSGKPQNIISQIIENKLEAYKKEKCLLLQPFVKDPAKTAQDLIQEYIAKLGENIVVNRFVRYEI